MNPNKNQLRTLLDDVLPFSAEQSGPARAEVLALLRHERACRRRRHAVSGVAAILALALWPLLLKHHPAAAPLVADVAWKPAPIVIQHVNDEQLFALLHGTPAALMEWPNGDRTLLIVKH